MLGKRVIVSHSRLRLLVRSPPFSLVSQLADFEESLIVIAAYAVIETSRIGSPPSLECVLGVPLSRIYREGLARLHVEDAVSVSRRPNRLREVLEVDCRGLGLCLTIAVCGFASCRGWMYSSRVAGLRPNTRSPHPWLLEDGHAGSTASGKDIPHQTIACRPTHSRSPFTGIEAREGASKR